MGLIESFIFYLIIALGIVVFFKLDSRMSILNRLLISILAVLVLLLLFVFISAIITIILVLVIVVLLILFLESKKISIRKFFRK